MKATFHCAQEAACAWCGCISSHLPRRAIWSQVTSYSHNAAPKHPSDSSGSTNDQETMDAGVAVEDFISTGRTGRRNAIADITDPCIGTVSTAGMDFSFDKLSVTDSKPACPQTDQKGNSSSDEKNNPPSKS